MLIEIVIIVAVIVALLVIADKVRGQKLTSHIANQSKGGRGFVSAHETIIKPSRKLVIDGTEAFPLEKSGFFKGFGVSGTKLCDARCFKKPGGIEDFPEAVSVAVKALYDEGTAMGAEVMRVVSQGRKLETGEALYFALATIGPKNDEYIMHVFVDKSR